MTDVITKRNKQKKNYSQFGVKRNWQLLVMLSGAVIFTFVFAYIPMYGIIMAFKITILP